MKKGSTISIGVVVCFAIMMLMFSCKSKTNNKLDTSDSQILTKNSATSIPLKVDLATSTIYWKGFKPGGSHHGTLKLKKAELFINGQQLESGSFILDMSSIVCEDLSDKAMNKNLVEHLKSADFFNVVEYPEGKFSITKVEKKGMDYQISGNLELKDIEKNISFPAKIVKEGDIYKAVVGAFSIDRTEWGINYASRNIFKNLKDAFIDDNIEISIVIQAS